MRDAWVVNYGSTGEASLIRAILENMELRVTLANVGNPSQFLDTLGETASADILVLTGHGKADGLWFGEFDPSVDTCTLKDGYLSVDRIEAHSKNSIAILTACETGNDKFASVFQRAGSKAFIGPASQPDGTAVPLILHKFFYGLVVDQKPIAPALKAAHEGIERKNHFELFEFA